MRQTFKELPITIVALNGITKYAKSATCIDMLNDCLCTYLSDG